MKTAFLLAAAVLLTGCASKTFTNRLVTTLDGKGAMVVSMYGPIGIAAKLNADDTAELQRLKMKEQK
jgi:hypothetical protein